MNKVNKALYFITRKGDKLVSIGEEGKHTHTHAHTHTHMHAHTHTHACTHTHKHA